MNDTRVRSTNKRQSYGSRSRSRSRSSKLYSPRRKHRSRSRERLRSHSSFKDRNFSSSRSRNLKCSPRRSSSSSPLDRRKRFGNDKFSSFVDSESRFTRLQKPEIQTSTRAGLDLQTDRIRTLTTTTTTYNTEIPLTLTERFTRLTTAGTALFNKRRYGRLADNNRLPHLILTNNTKLPPATLARQAKEISIVIDRALPPSGNKVTENNETYNYGSDRLIIPRRSNEGCRPVFDRPEITFYNTVSEEALILKKLSDHITSVSKSRRSNFPNGRKSHLDYHDISQFLGPGRFYGSRVDERVVDSKRSHPLDPSETPKGQSYYLHDDRTTDNYGQRRRWGNSRSNNLTSRSFASGYRRDRSQRRISRSPSRAHLSHTESPSNRWLHDKFEELEGESKSQQNTVYKPVPKPVPAPKPILWSTIGKEVNNGDKINERDDRNYSPNSALNQSPLTDTNDNMSSPHSVKETLSTTKHRFGKGDAEDSEDLRIDVDHVLDGAM